MPGIRSSILVCLFLFFSAWEGKAQADSVSQVKQPAGPVDSTDRNAVPKRRNLSRQLLPDSLAVQGLSSKDSLLQYDSGVERFQRIRAFEEVLKNHPYYSFFQKPVQPTLQFYQREDKDLLFYVLLILTFYFALLRIFFFKYIANLMALFFRVTLRQQQLREQLLQAALPSLLLNILFLLTGGLYLAMLSTQYHWADFSSVWLAWLYGVGLLTAIYLGKYLILKTVGWVFGVKNATDTYIFVVFLVNKVIGMGLLPVLWLIGFSPQAVFQIVIILSILMIGGLFLYRFLISYRPVRAEIKLNPFHFFLYLCAFEIAPLILIYKVLLNFV